MTRRLSLTAHQAATHSGRSLTHCPEWYLMSYSRPQASQQETEERNVRKGWLV